VLSRYGHGKTLMLGSYVGAAYETVRDAIAAKFYNGLLDWAGVERPVAVQGNGVEVRWLESGRSRLLFVFNHSGNVQNTSIALPLGNEGYRATDLLANDSVRTAHGGGKLSLERQLKIDEVWVVKLEPEH
jgi:hypothetical protein